MLAQKIALETFEMGALALAKSQSPEWDNRIMLVLLAIYTVFAVLFVLFSVFLHGFLSAANMLTISSSKIRGWLNVRLRFKLVPYSPHRLNVERIGGLHGRSPCCVVLRLLRQAGAIACDPVGIVDRHAAVAELPEGEGVVEAIVHQELEERLDQGAVLLLLGMITSVP